MRIGAVLVLVLALIGPASAGPSTDHPSANEVMPGCRSFLEKVRTKPHFDEKSANKEEGLCIVGLMAADLIAAAGQHEICRPEGVTTGQLVAVVVKYADEHPQDMHLEFMFLAHEALVKAWPCKGSQAGLAEGKEDLSSANAIMPGCRSFLNEEPPSGGRAWRVWYMQGRCIGIINMRAR